MDTHPLTNTEGDIGSKIRGALVLEELCKDTLPDLFLLYAALPSRGDMARTVAHTSADAFIDTFVNSNRLPPRVSIGRVEPGLLAGRKAESDFATIE